jgi:hypothetical protein
VAERDFAINARVRRTLGRRWIRPQRLDVGTTDGVVFVKGPLEVEPGFREPFDRERLIRQLRSDLQAIPGVVDVVLEFRATQGEANQ